MIILVSGATETQRRYKHYPWFGSLVTPRQWNSLSHVAEIGKSWGVDNDAFNGWSEDRERAFITLLDKVCVLSDRSKLRFVAAPDVVGDASQTLDRWSRWAPLIRGRGLPAAYVLQDGAQDLPNCDALFVGGSTEFKLSREVDQFIADAQALGKWTHVGRVNTKCRLRHFYDIGVHSVDGTTFSRWPDKSFKAALNWLTRLDVQGSFLRAVRSK